MTRRRRGRSLRRRNEINALTPVEALLDLERAVRAEMSDAEARVGYPRQTSDERIAAVLDDAGWPRVHLPPETMR